MLARSEKLGLGILFTILTWTVMAGANACIKFALDTTSPNGALFFEYAFALVFFLPFALRKGLKPLKTNRF